MKTIIITVLATSLVNLEVVLYLDVITIPYLTPLAMAIGDSLYPFTPLVDPIFLYINIKQWLHPGKAAYRDATMGRRYGEMIIPQVIGTVMILFCILIKFSGVAQIIYGFEIEEMCVGPCWKLWAELVLEAMVILAVIIGWDLDGGHYERFIDRQIMQMKQKDMEKAEKERLASGWDNEKALGAV